MTDPTPPTLPSLPTGDDVRAAAARLAPHVRRTPVFRWRPRPSLPGVPDDVSIVLKLEQLQRGGSFKLRGALNALLSAPPESLGRGVFTASGGNHGIGVTVAARQLGAAATVYLPATAPAAVVERLQTLGATVRRAGSVWDEAYAAAAEAAAAEGGLLLHPFDDPRVIAGQGTAALEFLEDAPDLDLMLIAVGGGGLLGGAATVLAAAGRRVVGVEPAGADSLVRSLEAGRLVRLPSVHTIAGTLAPLSVSELTLRLCQERCAGVVRVSDDDIRAAVALLWDDLRLRLEPAGAAALAALCAGRVGPTLLGGARTIAVLLCGANA